MLTASLAPSSGRQVALRVKSLLSFGHKLGYMPFNAGAMIKVHGNNQSVASCRIVGWAMATILHTQLVLDALNMALATRRPHAGGLQGTSVPAAVSRQWPA